MYNMYAEIVILTTGIVSITVLHGAPLEQVKQCPPKKYYDTGTKRCDPCSDICRNAKTQGTEDICILKCPDYESSQSSSTPSTPSTSTPSSTNADRKFQNILVVCLVLASVAIVAVLMCRYKKKLPNLQRFGSKKKLENPENIEMIPNRADAQPQQPEQNPLDMRRPLPLALPRP